MAKRALIIGGGLGGLFCGAILAKEGLQVTILEKNATIGGGLQSFTRFGEVYDTGMHVVGGLQEGGNIRRLCQWLGIWDKVHVRPIPTECTDRLYFAEDRQYYDIASGKEGFAASLSKHFPRQHDNLKAYVEAMYRICDEMDLFHLRPSTRDIFSHSEEFTMPAGSFIRQYISDERLQQIVAYVNPLYGGRKEVTPAFIHATISVLHINGLSRFAGGSQLFAETLGSVVKEHGGEVISGDGVQRIHTEGRSITGITTRKGKHYAADLYISDIHPCALLPLFDEASALPKAYRTRMQEIPNTYSAFLLYLKLKPEAFRYLDYTGYYVQGYDKVWNPMGSAFLYMTPPEIEQGEFSRKMIIAAPTEWQEVKRWAGTAIGHRSEDYKAWKQRKAEFLLSRMEEMFPRFKDCIEDLDTASPLTIRDYYGAKEGTMFGYAKDCTNMALSQVPVVTKIPNLLLTGQCVNLHGFCGVPLTAINTCEAILGPNHVINKL
ncbi:MAG: NAD(P)/FAD-dependent oxidoreductase [Bacteroidaceae bacterium]|nr:NAD(P)/FAD-dependent oxidoreductase [Bacteroidaceae bacterium]